MREGVSWDCSLAEDGALDCASGPSQQEAPMWDIGCIAAGTAFFLIAIAYITGCERLGTKESKR